MYFPCKCRNCGCGRKQLFAFSHKADMNGTKLTFLAEFFLMAMCGDRIRKIYLKIMCCEIIMAG